MPALPALQDPVYMRASCPQWTGALADMVPFYRKRQDFSPAVSCFPGLFTGINPTGTWENPDVFPLLARELTGDSTQTVWAGFHRAEG